MSPDAPRITPVQDDDTGDRTRALFDRARRTYRWLPNTIRVMARGSTAGELYLEAGALNRESTLNDLERELLAVLTATRNGCEYCLTAHSVAALALGGSQEDVLAARGAESSEPRTEALLHFASALLHTAGRVSDAELAEARAAGLDDTTLLDIIGVVIENSLGNFINNLAQTPVDGVLARAASRADLPAAASRSHSPAGARPARAVP